MMNLHQNTDVARVCSVCQKIAAIFSKPIFADTRPAFISPEIGDDDSDIIPPAPRGRPKKGAPKGGSKGNAESESGDESSGPASPEEISGNESSDEDLTTMKRDTIQKKLISEVSISIMKQ
jgi:hypothetical protein